MATKIKSGQTLLLIGDSITDCGRRDAAKPWGNGYVKFLTDMLMAREPEKRLRIINEGISGDRATGLRSRWSDDVLRHRPDWLTIMIGINDLHSCLGDPKGGVSPAKYAEAYGSILLRTKAALPKCRVLLIDPFYISIERSSDSVRRQALDLLAEYIAIVHALSREHDTRLVKTHDIFQRLLKYFPADTFCPEPVHPNQTGHFVIADAVYQALSR